MHDPAPTAAHPTRLLRFGTLAALLLAPAAAGVATSSWFVTIITLAMTLGPYLAWLLLRLHQLNIGLAREVGRRRASESRLGTSEQQLRAILASTLDPIVTIDVHGIIQSASESGERVFGWRVDELRGRNVSMLMPEPHRSRHDEYLAEYRRTKRGADSGAHA